MEPLERAAAAGLPASFAERVLADFGPQILDDCAHLAELGASAAWLAEALRFWGPSLLLWLVDHRETQGTVPAILSYPTRPD